MKKSVSFICITFLTLLGGCASLNQESPSDVVTSSPTPTVPVVDRIAILTRHGRVEHKPPYSLAPGSATQICNAVTAGLNKPSINQMISNLCSQNDKPALNVITTRAVGIKQQNEGTNRFKATAKAVATAFSKHGYTCGIQNFANSTEEWADTGNPSEPHSSTDLLFRRVTTNSTGAKSSVYGFVMSRQIWQAFANHPNFPQYPAMWRSLKLELSTYDSSKYYDYMWILGLSGDKLVSLNRHPIATSTVPVPGCEGVEPPEL